jgi:hypothetical protein
VLAEEDARGIPPDVGAHGGQDEGDDASDPVVFGQHQRGKAAKKAGIKGHEHSTGDILRRPRDTLQHPPEQYGDDRESKSDGQRLGAIVQRSENHQHRPGHDRGQRHIDLAMTQRLAHLPRADSHRGGDDIAEPVFVQGQCAEHERGEGHADADGLGQIAAGP